MTRLLDTIVLDVRFSLRQLARSPLASAVAIVTLAIGIGLNTAVFSLVHAVLLGSLPYPESGRLVWIAPRDTRRAQDTYASRGDFRVWQQQTALFDGMAAYGTQDLGLVADGEASQERVASIEGDFWALTGARPALGRLFSDGDEGGTVISDGLFQRRFGGRRDVIGQAVTLAGAPFTIIGVLPPGFRVVFPQQTTALDELRDIDAFIALPRGEEPPGTVIAATDRPAPPWVLVFGRLQPGVSAAHANAGMQTVQQRLSRDYPRPTALLRGIRVVPLQDKLSEGTRVSLLILQGAVILVLFIAIANVANLQLTQAANRMREAAIRTALGAGRWRLARQGLVESAVLALVAGAAAAGVAHATVPVLVRFAPFTMTSVADIGVDGPVLAFTLVVSLVAAALFSWAPIVETSRVRLLDTLGGTAPTTTTAGVRTQGLLIGVEAALAVLLLTAAALMIQSLWHLQAFPAGFDPRGSYTMRVPLSGPRYDSAGQKYAYIDRLLEKLYGTLGVEAAGIAGATFNVPVRVSGQPAPGDEPPVVAVRMVSPDYLRAMGVSLVSGAWPTAANALDTVVVNQAFVRQLVPNGAPLGQAVRGSFVSGIILGVAANSPDSRLGEVARPEVYYPYQRSPVTRGIVVAVRMADPAVPVVRGLVEGIDRTQPVYRFQSVEHTLAESAAPRRFNMLLLDIYAGAAFIMALVGTFGVVARSVTRRRREMAVRIAVGAQPAAVVMLIVRQAMAYVFTGVLTGAIVAGAAGHVLRGLLYGVEPSDPVTIGITAIGLTVAALAACWLAAAGAARLDPMEALRPE